MLMPPPFYFASTTTNVSGTPAGGSLGTAVTSSATDNTDGTAVTALSALAHDVHYLVIGITGSAVNTFITSSLLDVLVDPAGGTSWSALIDDLIFGFTPPLAAGVTGHHVWYHFPIYIKSGTSIGLRCRTKNDGGPPINYCVIYAHGNPSRPSMWWCGQGVESLGINASVSEGTSVTAGNSGSFGSWTTIGTSTYRYGSVQYGSQSAQALTAVGYYWQIGYGSTKLPGSPTMYTSNSTSEFIAHTGFNQPIWCDVPASTTWQARGTCSGTAQTNNGAIYGVY